MNCSTPGLPVHHQLPEFTETHNLLQNGLVGSPCSPRDSQESSAAPQFKSINSSALSFMIQLSHPYVTQQCLYCLFQWCGYNIIRFSGFPGGSDGWVWLQWERLRFNPWVGKIPWRRKWKPTPSILAWKIPWMEEPGRLQSMGSQRVGNDWATNIFTFIIRFYLLKILFWRRENQSTTYQ